MAESKAYKRLKKKYKPASQTMPANWSPAKKNPMRKPRSPFERFHKMKATYGQEAGYGGYAGERTSFAR